MTSALVDDVQSLLFPSPNDPLRQRIGLMAGLMGGLTLALLLISAIVEITHLWRDTSFPGLARWAGIRFLAFSAFAMLSMTPFVLGVHVSRRTERPRLLFGVCLVLFFAGFALRTFLFFDHVQGHIRGEGGAEGALAVLIGEPLASLSVVGLSWGLLRGRG